ncbi:MAG TPA: zinc-ribbon domain-containing protein [Bryobacteraceae bacterium]|nr:zinc-ribbon domain-containing protein [Bryobacteraceae bacterium]
MCSYPESDTVGMTMTCPNCGLANPDNAKFCANCGTAFGPAPQEPPPGSPVQPGGPYQPPRYQPAPPPRTSNTVGKNIGIGCLVAIVIFLILGLSCTRACRRIGRGRTYIHHRY